MLLLWFGIMQIFNPASTTVVYGLLGVKLFFWYISLYFIGYALFNSEAELRRFFRLNAWLTMIITGLGIAQSIIGPSFLNPGNLAAGIRELSTLYRVSPITGLVSYRAPSVFVSAGRYTNYLLIAWVLVLAFSGYLLLRRGRNIAFIWGAPWRQREVIRIFRTVQRAALAIGLAIVALFFAFPDALLARLAIYSETLTPGSSASELQTRTWDYPVRNFLGAFNYDRWPYGYGIATSSLGVQCVS